MQVKFTLTLIALFLFGQIDAQDSFCDCMYVWNFSMEQNEEQNQTTKIFTKDVEAALIAFPLCKIVQRRDLPKLLIHSGNERRIHTVKDISAGTRKTMMEVHEAKIVVFGTVQEHFSINNQTVEIRLSFENLKTLLVMKTMSIVLEKEMISATSQDRIAEIKKQMKNEFSYTIIKGNLINEINKQSIDSCKVCVDSPSTNCTDTQDNGLFILRVFDSGNKNKATTLYILNANNELIATRKKPLNEWAVAKRMYIVRPLKEENFHFQRRCTPHYSDLRPTRRDRKWGYLNQFNVLVIDYRYDDAYCFSEGLAPVKIKGSWGYIDQEGKVIVGFKYDAASVFKNGAAEVEQSMDIFNINKKGKRNSKTK